MYRSARGLCLARWPPEGRQKSAAGGAIAVRGAYLLLRESEVARAAAWLLLVLLDVEGADLLLRIARRLLVVLGDRLRRLLSAAGLHEFRAELHVVGLVLGLGRIIGLDRLGVEAAVAGYLSGCLSLVRLFSALLLRGLGELLLLVLEGGGHKLLFDSLFLDWVREGVILFVELFIEVVFQLLLIDAKLLFAPCVRLGSLALGGRAAECRDFLLVGEVLGTRRGEILCFVWCELRGIFEDHVRNGVGGLCIRIRLGQLALS